jgi:hypothetical protein
MKKIILSVVILSSAILFGCKNMGGGDPKTVLIQFMDALSKKDMATARKLTTADSKQLLDLMEMGMKNSSEDKDLDKYDKSKLEIGEAQIDGDKATIPVKEKESGENINFYLKKEDGSWKVAFNKESMMQMGMDQMKEKGISNPMDSLSKGMDEMKKGMEELKNVNMDSLKQSMQEGMKALDSVNKELKKIQ